MLIIIKKYCRLFKNKKKIKRKKYKFEFNKKIFKSKLLSFIDR